MARPPEDVLRALRDGLSLHTVWKLSGPGLRPETVKEARKIVRTGTVDPGKVARMRAWLARHGANPKEARKRLVDRTSPAWVSWQLWGGDAAVRWLQVPMSRASNPPKATKAPKVKISVREGHPGEVEVSTAGGSYVVFTYGQPWRVAAAVRSEGWRELPKHIEETAEDPAAYVAAIGAKREEFGVGVALLQAALVAMKKRGVKQVWAVISPLRGRPEHHLPVYEDLGFRREKNYDGKFVVGADLRAVGSRKKNPRTSSGASVEALRGMLLAEVEDWMLHGDQRGWSLNWWLPIFQDVGFRREDGVGLSAFEFTLRTKLDEVGSHNEDRVVGAQGLMEQLRNASSAQIQRYAAHREAQKNRRSNPLLSKPPQWLSDLNRAGTRRLEEFVGRSTEDTRMGVHTTSNVALAAAYAMSGCNRRHSDFGSRSEYPIVIELDITGLKYLADEDALAQLYETVKDPETLSIIREGLESGDSVYEIAQQMDEFDQQSDSRQVAELIEAGVYHRNIPRAVLDFYGDDEGKARDELQLLLRLGVIDQRIGVGLVDQRRYLRDFDLDRVVKVSVFRPWYNDIVMPWWDAGEDSEEALEAARIEAHGWKLYTVDDEGNWPLDKRDIWVNPALRGRKGLQTQYHGTVSSLAQQAFPTLPWPASAPFPILPESEDGERD